MTSSKSRASTSRFVALAVVVLALFAMTTAAEAGRKRLVVLDFEGPKAAQFQADLTALLKKQGNTVYSTSKWNSTADDLDASKVTEKNVKKVAKKLKIDGVIEGKIEKRRDEYIVKLKLRGKDGEVLATVSTKAEGTHLDGSAMKDVKDELLPQVESLTANRGGGGGDDDEDAAPPKKTPKKEKVEKSEDDDSDAPPPKKGFSKKHPQKGNDSTDDDSEATPPKKAPKKVEKKHDDDDDSPIAKASPKKKAEKAEKSEDDAEATSDDDAPKKKPAKKKVAKKTDDDGNVIEDSSEGGSDDGEPSSAAMTTPAERAVDLVVGLSFMARRMGFTYSADLGKPPPGYKGTPVGGFLVDATVYPADISHKRDDMLKNIGLTVMVDKVIKISSKVNLMGTPTTLDTSELHYAVGAVFRYPFNKTPSSPVIGATLRYGGHSFTVARNTEADIPNVGYKIVDPSVFIKYPANDKITLNANLGFMVITTAGQITTSASYGSASVTGFEGELSGDYAITKNLFARAAFRFETIGFKFKGTGMQSTGRDADATQDVFGARDTYVGGAVTLGYAY
jgi:hypothetical protein